MEKRDLSGSGAKSRGPKPSGNVVVPVPTAKKRPLDVAAILALK